MSEINRINILEQRFNDGGLTEIEQDELFELLKQEDRLECWLDSGVKLTPPEDIVYADKDFLKSIAEPIEKLESDRSIVYKNKKQLYRKGGIFYLTRNIKIAVAVVIILFISDLSQHSSYHYQEDKESVVRLAKEQLSSKDTFDIKVTHYHIEIEPILISHSIEDYVLIEDLNNIFNLHDTELKIEMKEIAKPIVNDKTPIEKPEELVLFAQAEQWKEIVEPYQEEMIIENEEWQSSQTKPQRKMRNILRRLKNM